MRSLVAMLHLAKTVCHEYTIFQSNRISDKIAFIHLKKNLCFARREVLRYKRDNIYILYSHIHSILKPIAVA